MNEEWRELESFPGYSVSSFGRLRADKSGRILSLNENQFGLLQVGIMKDGIQFHRSVPLLVAKAFIEQPSEAFDTPINLNGDRRDNSVGNLMWRPRWFAVKYNQQFKHPFDNPITVPIVDLKTGEYYDNSFDCATKNGYLERDLVLSIINRTYVWPTYHEYGIV